MKILVIVNDQPYGSERPYNALRLANALAKRDQTELRMFLLGDAVACAIAGQTLPDGHYHLDRMIKGLLHHAQVACCGTCHAARGLSEDSTDSWPGPVGRERPGETSACAGGLVRRSPTSCTTIVFERSSGEWCAGEPLVAEALAGRIPASRCKRSPS